MGQFIETAAGLIRWTFANPVSGLFLALTIASAWILAPWVARRLNWGQAGTRIMLFGAGLSLIPTIVARVGTRDLGLHPRAVDICGTGFSRPWLDPAEVLNVLLLVPFAVGITLASRSLLVAVPAILLLSVAIERAQAVTALGQCDQEDSVRYFLGGAAAAAATYLVLRVRQRSHQEWEPSTPSAAATRERR